ncbi:MAG TPA: hypothetical protein DCZ72_11390 [Armatimonadetes bacterium]|nr:hypothetical protein [Armatimonadota bacterium]
MATRQGAVTVIHAVAPGSIIRRELEARDWTQQQFADVMGRPLKSLNEIIAAKKQITAETAAELGHAFGISAERWLNMEGRYRLSLAQPPAAEQRLQAIAERSDVLAAVPRVEDLEARGWLGADD